MQLIDTHCHLSFDPIIGKIDDVLKDADRAGVTSIIVPAYDRKSWDDIARIAAYNQVFPVFGIHPWVSDELEYDFDKIQTYIKKYQAVAIGEIGLDFKIKNFNKQSQIDLFEKQIELALELDLPVLMHCRGAFNELLDILATYNGKVRGVIHAFSRSIDLAERFVALGIFVSFGGAITRENAKKALNSAKHLPLQNIVLETDAPAIGLDGVLAKDAEPKHVLDIAKALSKLRNLKIEEIAEVTTQNAKRLFRLT